MEDIALRAHGVYCILEVMSCCRSARPRLSTEFAALGHAGDFVAGPPVVQAKHPYGKPARSSESWAFSLGTSRPASGSPRCAVSRVLLPMRPSG